MEIADKVSQLVFGVYDSLGKTGKPESGKEWTLLSGFVVEYEHIMTPVSVATGTKCLGYSSVCSEGTTVNDSHAEVLSRRCFLKYLMHEMKLLKIHGSSNIFSFAPDEKYKLKDGVKIYFYTSQVPCGDASIVKMNDEEASKVGEKRKKAADDQVENKKAKSDVHRTGAKPVKGDPRQDPKGEGIFYHTRGAVRTKPGRGDPTRSLSCTDKISKWIFAGVQGSLLSLLISSKIPIDTIVVGGGSQYDYTILRESLVGRSQCCYCPELLQSTLVFKDSRQATGASKPCPKSIMWFNIPKRDAEYGINGRKHGSTKKNISVLSICRREMFKEFLFFMNFPDSSYGDVKKTATDYQKAVEALKKRLGAWSDGKAEKQKFIL